MTETTSQMLEAQAQLKGMLRVSALFVAGILILILSLEMWLSPGVPQLAFGFLVGCLYAAANLFLLFRFLAPYFLQREKGAYFALGMLVSLVAGGLLMFAATQIGAWWAIGVALGVASPAMLGTIHALQHFSATSSK